MSLSVPSEAIHAETQRSSSDSGLDKASPRIRRRHFFELHDRPWWPVPLREFMTNLLIIAWTFPWISFKKDGKNIIPSFSVVTERIFERFFKQLKSAGQPISQVNDLCSGSGGPWESLRPFIEKHHLKVVLSDLYPPPLQPHPWSKPGNDQTAIESNAVPSNEQAAIEYYPQPVDATNLPDSLDGLRSVCSGFHHFQPDFATSILQDCVDKKLPVVIIETSARSFVQMCGSPFFMAFMALATPIAYPRKTPWYLWVLTYIFPITVLCSCFDGLASCYRAYRPNEMLTVASRCNGAESYRWEAGTETCYGLFSLVYMTGRPLTANEPSQD